MKRNSQRRLVTIEEHSVTFGRDDLLELVQAEEPEMFASLDERDMTPSLVIQTTDKDGEAKHAVLQPARLIEMMRSVDEEIPENAEVVLAVRWRKEVEAQAMPPVAGRVQPPTPILPAGVDHDTSYLAEAAASGESCETCGGVPDIQGPTPDCHDVSGCARVRTTKGEIAVARTVEPENAPRVGIGGTGPGTHKLVNRETGETAFADKNGMPYGKHEDYSR